jgi:hypothetical protein
MSTLLGMRARIEVNPRTVRTSGFMAAADVRDVTDHALMGAEYETDTCIADVGGEWIDKCLMTHGGLASGGPAATAPNVPVGAPNEPWTLHDHKSFQDPYDLVAGDPFTTFAGVKCDLVSFDEAEYRAKSLRKFEMVESRQVDYHMARLIENNGNDLGDCPLSQMLMNADYTALNEYGSYPLIAMSAPLALCAAAQSLIYLDANYHWRSVNGAFITTIAHDARNSTANFFMTGHVTLLRGPKETYSTVEVKDNVRHTLTERIYVPLIECMAYYATATCDAPITI